MDQPLQTLVTTVITIIIANWVTIYPILKTVIKFTWEKTIEWQKVIETITKHGSEIEQLKKDVKAAHDKIRSFKA